MGEAKRRKQLGLMPTIYSYEVQKMGDEIVMVSGPDDSAKREQILETLRRHLKDELAWEKNYRRQYVMAGMPQKLLHTAKDVEAIPVPPYRRWTGELLENYVPQQAGGLSLALITEYAPVESGKRPDERGSWVHLKEEFSFDGKQWSDFPEPANPFEALQYLLQHPVTRVKGELVGTYQHEHHSDGRQSFVPEPSAEHREKLEKLMQSWNGSTPEEWREIYYEAINADPDTEEAVPVAIRTVIELRQPAPMPGLSGIALDTLGGLDVFVPYEGRLVSFDGESWEEYKQVLEDIDDNFDLD